MMTYSEHVQTYILQRGHIWVVIYFRLIHGSSDLLGRHSCISSSLWNQLQRHRNGGLMSVDASCVSGHYLYLNSSLSTPSSQRIANSHSILHIPTRLRFLEGYRSLPWPHRGDRATIQLMISIWLRFSPIHFATIFHTDLRQIMPFRSRYLLKLKRYPRIFYDLYAFYDYTHIL